MTARFYKMIVFLCVLFMVSLSGSASAWEAPKIEKPKSLANYPERPIDFICGWGVGGGADLMSRKIADLVREYYGITLVVTNMPGASGVKGIDYAMRQPHDGHTIFFAAWDAYMNYLLKKTNWAPEQINLIAIAQRLPGAYFVPKDSPFKTWQEVIDYSKKHPYKLRLADVGRGGLGDFTLTLWEQKAGLKLTYVPYDSPSQRYASFSGGHVDLMYEQPGDIAALIEAGARPLVFMSSKRHSDFPDTPCSVELGYDITLDLWRGIGVAADMPADIREYLSKIFAAVCESPQWQQFLKDIMANPEVYTGDTANKVFMDEYHMVKGMMQQQ